MTTKVLRFPGEHGATYAWAALLENTGPDAAHAVDLIATVRGPGGAERKEHVVVDEIPPGQFAWGSKPGPLLGSNGERVAAETVDLVAVPTSVGGPVPDDRLLSSDRFVYNGWPQSLTVQPASDPRQLFAVLSYYNGAGEFLFASVNPLDQSKLVVGQASVVNVYGIYSTELPDVAQVRVVLTRLPEIPIEQPVGDTPGSTSRR